MGASQKEKASAVQGGTALALVGDGESVAILTGPGWGGRPVGPDHFDCWSIVSVKVDVRIGVSVFKLSV